MQIEEKTYSVPREVILNAIWDMAELQCGQKTLDDTANGKIGFRTRMYGHFYEYRVAVASTETGCRVRLEVTGHAGEAGLHRAFSLLESLIGSPLEADGPTAQKGGEAH